MKQLAISISGGGALGIGPLAFMQRMEQELGEKLCNISFAYGGTSTGSIIAAGLAEGLQAHEIFELYRKNLKNMFKKYPWYTILDAKCPKYDHTNLKKMLQNTFKGNVGDWNKPVYIPTTYMNGKSEEKVWDLGDKSIEKWFAVLTSCSAPTYFDVIVRDGHSFCDGGMWANDPIATLQAGLTKSGHSNYKILSFNTGMDTPHTACGNMTKLQWLEYILKVWVARSGMANYYEVCANIGEDNVFRASPYHDAQIDMDKTDDKTVNKVIKIWEDYFEKVKPELKEFLKR